MSGYIYVKPSIIGNHDEGYSTSYDSDYKEYPTREKAQLAAFELLDHDDFLVGRMEAGKVAELFWSDQPRDDQEEVDEVNRILCLP